MRREREITPILFLWLATATNKKMFFSCKSPQSKRDRLFLGKRSNLEAPLKCQLG